MSCFVHLYSVAVRTHIYAYMHVSRVHFKTYVHMVFTCTHIHLRMFIQNVVLTQVCVYEHLCMHVFACTSDVCMEAVDFSSAEMYDMVCMCMHPYACRHVRMYAYRHACLCVYADRRFAFTSCCVRMWLVLHVCTNIHACQHTCIHMCIHTYVHACIV